MIIEMQMLHFTFTYFSIGAYTLKGGYKSASSFCLWVFSSFLAQSGNIHTSLFGEALCVV